jgi:hypothetical protein
MPTVRYKDNPKEYLRQYYLEHKAKYNDQARRWAKAHPEKCVAASRKWKYGLTADEQQVLLSKPCAICGNKATHIDHCHQTNRVRGGLCNNCNTGLGMFRDNPALMVNAIKYVKSKL